MKPTRREFLQTSALIAVGETLPAPAGAASSPQHEQLDGFQIARHHAMVRELPGEDFFEGMLLGNGDVGVCAVVRPDALGLHIGKSDSWDIRVSEDIEKYILTFTELLKLWDRASEEAKRLGKPDMLFLESSIPSFRDYTRKVESSYARPWPRPWPCGTVWIHWDPRWVEASKQTLDPATGLYTLDLTCNPVTGGSRLVKVSCFVDWMTGLVSVWTAEAVPFLSVDYYPDLDNYHASPIHFGEAPTSWGVLPRPEIDGRSADGFAEFSCFQYFPALGPTEEMPNPPRSDKDRNFALHGRIAGAWQVEGLAESQQRLKEAASSGGTFTEYGLPPGVYLKSSHTQPLRLDIKVATPRDILLEKLEHQARESGNPHPWIIIPQDHAYEEAEMDTPSYARKEVERLAAMDFSRIREDSQANWRKFWSRSAVELEDKELERIWYQNQYWLACCLRERKTAPGLFGN